MSYLTSNEVAKDLGINVRTVQMYCKEGFLPARLCFANSRTSYEVDCAKYLEWKNKHFKGHRKGPKCKRSRVTKDFSREELEVIALDWLDWCKTGKLTGKPLSPRTIEIYETYFKLYLKQLGKYPQKPIVSVNNLRSVLGSFAPERFSTKRNIYDAVMSLTKYLIENDRLKEDIRVKMKSLKPRRFIPAKKTSINETQLQKLYDTIDGMNYGNEHNRLTSKALVVFLANTGLRAAECCRLKLEDIDLEARRVNVKLGKGNKNRIVGINDETYDALADYLKGRLRIEGKDHFFLNREARPFTVDRLGKRISSIAKKAGLKDISPHSLRRSFVTINVNKGKPLNHLRIACGHSDISTTQGYCMTSVDEVVEAMKDW